MSTLTAPGGASAVLEVRGLTKRYGAFTAADDVSFSVNQGEVFGFLGPNGAGKSTTIGMLLGLIQPTAGAISLFGLPAAMLHEGLANVGGIIEAPAFYPYLSGRDNLRALAHLRPGTTDARIDGVLEMVGLGEAATRKFGKYSMGMKQRLGIAWTLLHDPDLLILDEPTNGLDPAGMLEVRHLILSLAGQGKTIFISSHLLHEIEQVCDRVAVIQRGKVIAEGIVDELLSRTERLVIRTPQLDEAAALLRARDDVRDVEVADDHLRVDASGVRPARLNAELVRAGIEVDELRRERATLEATFLELTGGEWEASAAE